jgi:ribosomal protein L11 methyltransferase
MSAEPESWKIILPCTRMEAQAIALDHPALEEIDPVPVVMTREPDESAPDRWLLEIYSAVQPDAALIATLRELVPSAARTEPQVERLGAQDWVSLSQAGLPPIQAGRFFVHTGNDPVAIPPGAVPFRIGAGRAFGTGQHQTTAGCLRMIDRLRREGRPVRRLADIGTGTGLLAFAAMRLWPHARAIASDIDPVSIEITRENAALNSVALGRGPGRLRLAVAAGLDHPTIAKEGPYDLVLANILAAALVDLAPAIGRATAPGGTVVLAGLLDNQATAVTAAYRRRGFLPVDRVQSGDWPVLRLRKRASARALLPVAGLRLPPTPW